LLKVQVYKIRPYVYVVHKHGYKLHYIDIKWYNINIDFIFWNINYEFYKLCIIREQDSIIFRIFENENKSILFYNFWI
jgi:hypothetical protein